MRNTPAGRSTAEYWIERLALEPHPEGGYYRETYRSAVILPQGALPGGFKGDRAATTAIYFLLKRGQFSAFHRLRSDEIWHFYAGECLAVHMIDGAGKYGKFLLGSNPDQGEVPQGVVSAGCWFASAVEPGAAPHEAGSESFALVGCTVSPGFDFADFELADPKSLMDCYPQHREMIERFTHRGKGHS